MKKNRFKQKSFAYAIYATLGVVLVGAIVYAVYIGTNEPEVVPVDAMVHNNLLHPPTQAPQMLSPGFEQNQTVDQHTGIREFFNQNQEQEESQPVESQAPAEVPEIQENLPTPEPEPQAMEAMEPAVPVFNAFTGDTNMLWPVVGTVALEYSSDAMIWDPTLELFARNDTMRIATTVGSHVRAATDGIVSEISYDARYGNTMTIDHGNGWMTTYNQLDGMTVNQGDVVATGQIIGTVAEPTRFTVGLGDNIGFRIMHNETTVDPMTLLP